MVDQQKRKTLQLISGAGVGLGLAGFSLTGHAAALNPGSVPASGQLSSAIQIEILVEISAGKAVPGDTVFMRNNTSAAVEIDHFTPGIVAFRDSMIDLNLLFRDNRISIAPRQLISATAARWQLLAAPMFKEYLWADNSAIKLSDYDIYIVRLDGIHSGTQVILSSSMNAAYS